MDFETGMCEISGVSSVSLVSDCNPIMHPAGVSFPLREVGDIQIPDPLNKNIPAPVWEMVSNAPPLEADGPPEGVVSLAEKRLGVRAAKNWAESDKLRDEISALGWTVQDGKDGYKLVKN
jgi:hypothetical protein